MVFIPGDCTLYCKVMFFTGSELVPSQLELVGAVPQLELLAELCEAGNVIYVGGIYLWKPNWV